MKTNPSLKIGNWPMEKLIRFYYPRIKEIVLFKAFKMQLDANELLSQVNYNLGTAMVNKAFTGETESQFIAWINTLIFNAGINLSRMNKRDTSLFVDIDNQDLDIEHKTITKSYQPCDAHKLLLKRVSCYIEERYSAKNNNFYVDVFNRNLIDGDSYIEVADKLKIPISSVKNAIFQIRKTLSEKFGREYSELINN